MDPKHQVRISKFLSRHLRHAPEDIGLSLQPGGWVAVADLLTACTKAGVVVTQDELETVVRENDKQRFAFDESGALIRANQGHSVEVDLQLEEAEPPAVLFHGTGEGTVPAIERDGLRKMSRHHVHLSTDVPTARKVGARHGCPVVFAIDALALRAAGVTFFRSANGVWLVEAVPPQFLQRHDEG